MTAITDAASKNYYSLFPEERIASMLDAFVINQPMSGSVGGDGFWVHQTLQHLFIIVFDCMGHGHLASMMTRIYTRALEEVLQVQKEEDPSKILECLHQQIKKQFDGKENLQVGSGADVGVVKVDMMVRQIEFAGAKMELSFVKNGQFETVKPDRVQIGDHFDIDHSYVTQTLELDNQKHNFYLASDGLKDLFGGFEAKKLGKSNVKKLFEENYSNPMAVQKQNLTKFISDWSGGIQPLDDLLVVGFSL